MWPGGTLHSDILGGRKAFVLLLLGATVPESCIESSCGCHSPLFAAPRRLLSTLAAITEGINSPLEIRRGMKTFCFTLLKFITVLNAAVFACQGLQNKAPQNWWLKQDMLFLQTGLPGQACCGKGSGTADFKVFTFSFAYTALCFQALGSALPPTPFLSPRKKGRAMTTLQTAGSLKHIRQDLTMLLT